MLAMKRNKATQPSLPLHDYRLALQSAVSWLGDRYLLAAPVVRPNAGPNPFFAETRRWLPASRS